MTQTQVLDQAELQRRLNDMQRGGFPNGKQYEYITPLGQTANSLHSVLTNSEKRFMLGLEQIDVLTRGFGAKELALIVGFAHAGKTQLVNTMILNNLDKRILFFSLDDPSEMILTKLVCMREGFSAEELEHRARKFPQETGTLIRKHATHTFKNLLVPDQGMGLATMDRAIDESTDYWGEPPQAVVIDYLTLLPSDEDNADYSNVKSKSEHVKRWAKGQDAPVIVLHQNNRGKGGPGEVITMLSAAYGGEQEGTFMLGARRKMFDPDLEDFERKQHANTVTLHLVKNKRPPGRLTPPNGVDFFMDPDTGTVRRLRAEDLDRKGAAVVASQVQEAQAIREVRLPYAED